MTSLKEFADTLPDYAKDLRLNIGSVSYTHLTLPTILLV